MSATVSTLLQDINIKDGNFVDRLDNRTLYQANDYKLQLTFLDGNDRADGTDLAFSFVVQSTSGEVFDIAGAWTTATSGEGTISVPAASLNFTGTDYIGLIRFNGSVVAEFPLVVKAYGTPAPEAGTMIDWSIYTGYSSTATHGPVRPGTGITNVVNADGSNTHSVTYGSTASTAAEGNTVVKLTPTPSTVQTLNGGSGFTQLNITGESGYLAVGRTTSGGEAVHVVRDETTSGSWQVGILTTAKESEHSAYEIYRNETGNLFVGFWVSQVDKLCRAVYGLVAPIIKSAATTGLVVQNSAGTEKLKVGASTGADVQVTGDLSVTEKQATAYQNTDTRVATLASNETLTTASAICQFLNPDGVDRSITMPSTGLFSIRNTGSAGYRLNVYESDGTTLINFVENDEMLTFISTSADTWQVLDGGTGASSAQEALTALTDRNKETLAGTKALTSASSPYQFLDPDAVDRDVTLPTTGIFVIKNNGSTENILTVKNSLGTTVDTVEKDVTLSFLSTATDVWEVLG
jgi:hypothetical protein